MYRLYAALIVLFLCNRMIADEFPGDITGSVAKVLPSVVKIKVQRTDISSDESEWINIDAGGSGLVYDSPYRIVTNAHILKDARKIVVVDHTGTEYPAVLIGKDDTTDIALLDAPGLSLPVPGEANGTSLALGERIFVVGAPYSLGCSVSTGVVGSLKRFLPNYPYLHFLQTDAAINPGNSGGGVFNSSGELAGMVSSYFTKGGGYTNIGFAIPTADLRRIADRILREKGVERGYLGAELLVSDRVVRAIGYRNGVLVTHVDTASPAEKAGIRAGDLIVAIDNTPFSDNGQLHRMLERSYPGETIVLTLCRDKKESRHALRLGSRPNQKIPLSNAGSGDTAEKSGIILTETANGLIINATYGTAKTAGLEAGDMIKLFNAENVETIKQFNAQLSKLPGNGLAFLTLIRNQETIRLPIGNKNALKGYSTKN